MTFIKKPLETLLWVEAIYNKEKKNPLAPSAKPGKVLVITPFTLYGGRAGDGGLTL